MFEKILCISNAFFSGGTTLFCMLFAKFGYFGKEFIISGLAAVISLGVSVYFAWRNK